MSEARGWHSRGYLPHYDANGIVQHVVLRTRDSLPSAFYGSISRLDPREKRKLIDEALDASTTGKVFEDARCSNVLERQLMHFDGDRYDLLAWCIMPNHVHVVCCCLGETSLGQIVRTWKVQTTVAINHLLGRRGPIFAPDYFDRFMRNGQQTERVIGYVENNPVAAGFCQEPADWPHSSARHRASGWYPKTENLPLSLY